MLKEVYRYALKNRDTKVRKIRDSNYDGILAEAAARWTMYTPQQSPCVSAGVDSSWNKRAFQGLNLYAVDAVAVTSANELLAVEFEVDVSDSARNETLESKAMAMEASVAARALEQNGKAVVDTILIDGSIIPRLRGKNPLAASDLVRQYGEKSAVFISKSSESRAQFGELGSRAGDIYYYGKASKDSPGFSAPARASSESVNVTEVYARLRIGTPIIRLEFLGRVGEQDIKRSMDLLSYRSVSGYPYCLKYAHNNCKISDDDIDRLASVFGLQHEPGARVVLNE
ncbi:MAG: DNA double-strand break repair nuclease NurA [Nitrososphaera sp.]